ncbi:hypothetical protein ACP70R_023955 [Stipagrostis hirtigluma subsp. patula]
MVEHRTQPSSSTLTSVFGYVPSTGEYKVLRILWRKARTSDIQVYRVSSRYMPQVGGVAYFMLEPPLAPAEIELDGIASFDFATEEWRPTMIQGPLRKVIKYPTGLVSLQLAKLNDCLVTVHYNNQDVSRDLWFLEDVDKSLWTKRYSVRCESGPLLDLHPMLVLDDGRVVFLVGQYLRSYDQRTSTWADLTMVGGYHSVRMHHGSLLYSGKHGAVVDAAGR